MNFAGEGANSRRDDVREAMSQEKKEREHLLALNQVIARQVMEKSRMVAGAYAVEILLFSFLYKLFLVAIQLSLAKSDAQGTFVNDCDT